MARSARSARNSYTKADVTLHASERGRGMIPAVNVKVHGKWDVLHADLVARVAKDHDVTDWFTPEWIRTHHNPDEDAVWDTLFNWACEDGWEQMQEDAREIFRDSRSNYADPPNMRLKVYSLGRGGWAYIEGLPDLEDWDAVMLAKWRKFERWAEAGAADVPYVMLELYLMNFAEELHEREKAANWTRELTELYADRQALGF